MMIYWHLFIITNYIVIEKIFEQLYLAFCESRLEPIINYMWYHNYGGMNSGVHTLVAICANKNKHLLTALFALCSFLFTLRAS